MVTSVLFFNQSESKLLHVFCSMFNVYTKKDGRRGIEPKTGLNPFVKTALNVFSTQKTFLLEFFFLI